jgi:hypothetical protein
MQIERLLNRFYMDQAGGADGGGTGADTATGGTGADTVAGATGADAGGAGKDPSLLEALGKGGTSAAADGGDAGKGGQGDAQDKNLTPEQRALQASEKDTRRPASVPAKYWDAEKGEVKFDAWAKSTQQLETRMRDVGLPPKEASEYKFEVPKEMKDLGVDLDQTSSKAFQDKALSLGLTQKQYEGVMGAYFEHLGSAANQVQSFSRSKAEAELTAYYKTPEALQKNVALAFRAFNAYADEQDAELIDQIGNIPAVVRVLAKVGAEMGEDPGVNPDAILGGDSLEHLMRGGPGQEDAPYWNANHPAHKATVAKVSRFHEAQAAANRRKQAA